MPGCDCLIQVAKGKGRIRMAQNCCKNCCIGSYFFTVSQCDKESDLLIDHIDLLWEAISDVRCRYPFYLDAIVVLPEHLHAIMTLPAGDNDHMSRWQEIKKMFTRKMEQHYGTKVTSPWQDGYKERAISDNDDYRYYIDYIHYNPVRHGHVKKVRDWPYSSFDRFVRANIYNVDWNGCQKYSNSGRCC